MNSEKGFDKAAAQIRELKARIRRSEEENIGLNKKINQLESEAAELEKENRDLKEVINRAKDISSWSRPSSDNVRRLAKKAHLDIVKAAGGWVVKMGDIIGKKFKRLRDIWLILTRESWNLHDEFLPYESIPRSAPAPVAAPAPAPATAPAHDELSPRTLTRKEIAEIEILRAEWRMYPSMRPVIEETAARFGIVLEPR